MRITRRDLDPEILSKIDRLDNVLNSYDPALPEGYVSLGKDGFYLKRLNDTFLKRIYTEDELIDLEEAIYKPRSNVVSSYLKDIRYDEKLNQAAYKFLYEVNYTSEEEFDGDIIFTKVFDNTMIIVTDVGSIYGRVKEGHNKYESGNVLSLMSSHFNLANKIRPYDIVDIAKIDDSTFLIATSTFGVYKADLIKKELELLFNLEGIRKIEPAADRAVFVAADSMCALYDVDSGKRIEKYYTLLNERQLPIKTINSDGNIFVVGAPIGLYNLDNLLHLWKLDDAGVGYNLADSAVGKNSKNNKYQILHACQDAKYVYLTGLINTHLFIWKYNKETLRISEEIFDCISVDIMDGFLAFDAGYVLLSKDNLYLLENNEIKEHVKLKDACHTLKIYDGKIYSVTGNKLVEIEILKFTACDDKLSYLVFRGDESCNNIDILVKGAGRNEKITLRDPSNNSEIRPSYYMVYNNSSVIKLTNCKSKFIVMDINVTSRTLLEGIAVKKNRMFLR